MTGARYAQCWEDADVLLAALDVRAGDTCLSIASAGDNTLALLTRAPRRVIAIDFSPEQIACLELRVSAYRNLRHAQLLELLGSAPSTRRLELYKLCRTDLSGEARRFWDAREKGIARGIATVGRFERYLELFRTYLLPLVHARPVVARLLKGGALRQREDFYSTTWDSWRWRLLFRVFFSRLVMSRLGRDPRFFKYVNGQVAERLLERTRHGLTDTDPAENPYLQWIFSGRHTTALPCALRAENFQAIRANLDRLEWRCCSLAEFLESSNEHSIDRFNLSDVFEYMSPTQYSHALEQVARAGKCGGRLVYWNMLADRHRPEWLHMLLNPLAGLARELHLKDRAFFYSDLVIEEITG
jgi:S-adenosylmethionine-diacylglycerol 3-amino-3-carboxypropyl transferase